jgi:hypothetical protein
MLMAGTDMFLLIPDRSNERVLHRGKVLESSAEAFVAQFEEQICPEVDSDVNAYGDVRGKFFQQGAKVTEIRIVSPQPVIAFTRCGDPVSAENRQTFRVSTIAAGITAKVGKEKNCAIVDISPEGFGAVVKGELKVGSLVPVEFQYQGNVVNTPSRVQTVKIRPDGSVRYGFLAPERHSPARKALQLITTSLQREQLRRLSGAA